MTGLVIFLVIWFTGVIPCAIVWYRSPTRRLDRKVAGVAARTRIAELEARERKALGSG